MKNFRNKSVSTHAFAMVPRADIPRASFNIQKAYKTTFNAGLLIPVYCEEILPGDTFNVKMTAFARLSTPIFPLMDNMYLDSFFFFVPNRLVWDNWVRFMGEQDDPLDSISYEVPVFHTANAGVDPQTIFDYFGIPDNTGDNEINALPFRAYNLIWNQWFRDENLQDSVLVRKGDTGDVRADFALKRRGKRHDYFTSCLPWPIKGGVEVPLPLGSTAPVYAQEVAHAPGTTPFAMYLRGAASSSSPASNVALGSSAGVMGDTTTAVTMGTITDLVPSNLYADLSAATAATINQLRQSFQIQRLLERDARGGTRYTEIVRAHFGVISPDARLQRPEYLGGGSTPIIINPIVQSSATDVTGSSTPLGNLAAIGTLLANRHGFVQSFTEHGFVIGMVCVRADLTYQQGLRKMWSRSTRYDYYFPAFAMLGEQAVLQQEIYCGGSTGPDTTVFGYQERWAEYRYSPSMITGYLNSSAPDTLDAWHLAQSFGVAPVLGATFIEENPPMSRVLASGDVGPHFIFDSFFDMKCARPMPLFSVPGLIDHF